MKRMTQEQETMLDRLRREHPEEIGEQFPGGVRLCPEDLGYEERTECRYLRSLKDQDRPLGPTTCLKCWDRPFPEDAPKK